MKLIKGHYRDINNNIVRHGDHVRYTISTNNYPLAAIQRRGVVKVDADGNYSVVRSNGEHTDFAEIRAIELCNDLNN